MNKYYIIVDETKIEATDDGKILINDKEFNSLAEIEVVLNVLIKAIVSIVK